MLDLPNIIGATPQTEALPEAGSVNLPKLSLFGGLTIEGGTYDNPEFQITNAVFMPTTRWNSQIKEAYDQIQANEAARKNGGIGPSPPRIHGIEEECPRGSRHGNGFPAGFPSPDQSPGGVEIVHRGKPTLFLLDLPTFTFDVDISVEFVFGFHPRWPRGVWRLGADIKIGFGYDTLGLENTAQRRHRRYLGRILHQRYRLFHR